MKKIIFLFVVGILLAVVFTLGYNRQGEEPSSNGKKVAATLFPLYDITKNIAGEEVDTVLIVDPGVSPHSFDPSPEDIKRIQGSQAIFVINYGIDEWSSKLAKSAGIDKQIVADNNVNLREYTDAEEHIEEEGEDNHNEEGIDPHYWLSVTNAKGIAAQVRDELILLYPESKEVFEANYVTYEAELTKLDEEIRSELSAIEDRNIATFHNAWGYFAEEYDLTIVTTFEEFPGEEPSPEYVREFTEHIQEHDVKVIYAEPHFSTSSLEPIAADLGIQISQLAPEGMTGIHTYIELMRYNGLQISKSL